MLFEGDYTRVAISIRDRTTLAQARAYLDRDTLVPVCHLDIVDPVVAARDVNTVRAAEVSTPAPTMRAYI